MKRFGMFALAFAVVLVSCSDDPGALVHGIVQGQGQHVTAGAAQLPELVGWKLARGKDGRITMQRIIDPLLPAYAYAQDPVVVNGSPVPGAVVCVEEVAELVPFVRCTNTNNEGLATFFIDVETNRAGTYRAEIRGTLNNSPAVFDTIVAHVDAGQMDPALSQNWGYAPSPATLHVTGASDAYGNAIPFRLVSTGWLTVQGDTVGTVAARTVVFPATAIDSMPGALEIRGPGGELYGHAYYNFLISGGGPSIRFRVRGTSLPAP